MSKTLGRILEECRNDPVMLHILRPQLEALLTIIDRMPRHERTLNQYDLVAHLHRQREFSLRTFGPGELTATVLDHIRKELKEIEAAPGDLYEWIDVVLLALDGACRAGFTPEQVAQALDAKLTSNESRKWPEWRTVEPGKAIEHIR